jgi:hypothetical protein
MDLTDAEHLLRRWDPTSEPATPRTIEALDLVQFEHRAAEATDRFSCPTCGAPAQDPCEGGLAHRRRINLLDRPRSTDISADAPPVEASRAQRDPAYRPPSAFA